jgi:hypothetical protein
MAQARPKVRASLAVDVKASVLTDRRAPAAISYIGQPDADGARVGSDQIKAAVDDCGATNRRLTVIRMR